MGDFIDEYYTDKDLSLLKKLTLVIPTYNRNYYLSRCLWYHAHFPFGEIIVADSSPEEKKVVNRETVRKVRELFSANVRYLEYEPETEKYGGDIYRKWGDAVQHVETEYSQFCTDKEFLIPTTLYQCIAFLDQHPDFSIAEGMDYQIRSYSKDEIRFYPWQGEISFDHNTPIERIDAYLSSEKVGGTLFSVQRSATQKDIYRNLSDYHVWDIRFGETAIEIQPFLWGKTKKFTDLPANCRDILHTEEYSLIRTKTKKAESSFTRYPLLRDYPLEIMNELSQNLEELFSTVLNEMRRKGEIDWIEDAQPEVLKLMKKRYVCTCPLLQYKLIGTLWDNLPLGIKKTLSKYLGKNSFQNSAIPTMEMRYILSIIEQWDQFHESDTVIPIEK